MFWPVILTVMVGLLLSTVAFAQVWLVGEKGAGLWDGREAHYQPMAIHSHAVNPRTCELWVEENLVVKRVKPDLGIATVATGKVLFADETTLLTIQGEKLTVRDANGVALFEAEAPWGLNVTAFTRAGDGFAFLQNGDFRKGRRDHQLELVLLNREFKEVSRSVVAQREVLFGNQNLLWDESRQLLWVGYSASTSEHFYTPFVEARSLSGSLVVQHQWAERGLFFDFCLSEAGELIAGRDIPSNSGFTVPVYSFLEALSPTGEKKTIYALHENYFPDTFLCQKEKLIVERSIFGSDGSRVLNWQDKKVLFDLPWPVNQITQCK